MGGPGDQAPGTQDIRQAEVKEREKLPLAKETSDDFFKQYNDIYELKIQEKREAVARLLQKLKIDPKDILDWKHGLRAIKAKIYSLRIQEKGIYPGVHVTLNGKVGEFVVSKINDAGFIIIEGTKGAFLVDSVNLLK